MDATQWFHARGGAQQGPVSGDELKRLAESGVLGPHDLVWREGMAQWQPAQAATGFFAVAALPPPQFPYGPPSPAAPPYAPPGAPLPGYYAAGAHPQPYPQQYPPAPAIGDNAGVRMLLPVGRSGWAIAAGYLGLFSVLGCVAPFALVVSIIAIRDIKAHPDRRGMGRAVFGLVMGILGTIFLMVAVVALVSESW